MPTAPSFAAEQAARLERLRTELARALRQAGPVTLELGCGHGHFLSQYAPAHPDETCIGVDLKPTRIAKATNKAEIAEAENTAYLWADVRDVLAVWPKTIPLHRVFVLFPDPWPKARHTKHRMLQPELLRSLAALAQPTARLFFRTDDFALMAWTRAQGPGSGWHEANGEPWPFEVKTVFEGYATRFQSLVLAPEQID